MLDFLRHIKNFITNTFIKLVSEKTIADYHIHPSAKLYGKKKIEVHETALIAEYVIARVPVGFLKVGQNSQIGPFTVIFSGINGILIGDNVMIAPHCVLAEGSHDYKQMDLPMRFAGSLSKGPIIIEDDVWIGAHCTILDGVRIGEGAVVSANSLVNKDILPYTIVGGCPAKLLGNRNNLKSND